MAINKPNSRAIHVKSSEEMNSIIKENNIVIIDFYADWCPPCRVIGPKFEDLSSQASMSEVKFLKLNIDELPNVGASYSIRSIPTFIVFYKGKEVNRLVGGSIDQIKETLQNQLNK